VPRVKVDTTRRVVTGSSPVSATSSADYALGQERFAVPRVKVDTTRRVVTGDRPVSATSSADYALGYRRAAALLCLGSR